MAVFSLLVTLSVLVVFLPASLASNPFSNVSTVDANLPSTVVLPLYGDADDDGRFYVKVKVGEQQRTFSLDIDSGSDLIWLKNTEYMPPKEDLVDCDDPICAEVGGKKCKGDRRCSYSVKYADKTTANGYLVWGNFPLKFKDGVRNARLVIGRGDTQQPIPAEDFDGILGLGKGKASIVSQLHDQGITRKITGHCLSGKGVGYFFVGADVFDPSHVTWAPMHPNKDDDYEVSFNELLFDGKPTRVSNLPVKFDSGASRTYLQTRAYGSVRSKVNTGLSGSPLTPTKAAENFEECWKGKEPIKNIGEVTKYFKPMTLRVSESVEYKLQPQDYLILVNENMVCFAIEEDPESSTIGDLSMLDRMVIYDNERQRIGWVSADCDRTPSGKGIAFVAD